MDYRVIPQDGAERRNQEEERKINHKKAMFKSSKRSYILFKSTQLMTICAFGEYFF